MPRDGAFILSDLRSPTLSIACEPCGCRGIYNVARLMEQHGDAKLTDLLQTLANCPKARPVSVHDRWGVFERLSWACPTGPPPTCSAAVHVKQFCLANRAYGPRNRERNGMSEGMSRRKALSLLGLGAALGFTLSALEPLEAEAQEAAAPAAAPAEATGTHGMNRRQSRRHGRHERRRGRHERRHERRTGEKPEATAPAATPPPQ